MNFSSKPPGVKKLTVRTEKTRVKVVPGATSRPVTAAPPRPAGSRFQLTPTVTTKALPAQRSLKKTVEDRSIGISRKRKGTPQLNAPLFSDDEGDDSSEIATSDSDGPRKRVKSSVSSLESDAGPRRQLVLDTAFEEPEKPLKFVDSAYLTSGKHAAKYVIPWKYEEPTTVRLQYPSKTRREKFELKLRKDGSENEYRPMVEMKETVKAIAQFYFPPDLAAEWTTSMTTGAERRFSRAWQMEDIDEWHDIVKEFNSLVQKLVADGTIQRQLRVKTRMHLDWVKHILDQISCRTVSPHAEILNKYKNGSDNVYGELLPRFVNEIIVKTKLDHEKVFIDLGSGVGNVVLQMALQVGCESWGIEMMENPCSLAALQLREFKARTRLWGLNVGAATLLKGDMTQNSTVIAVLRRADAVLVNNQAFGPELNNKLRDLFLELKTGCQVVSLKPFVPDGHKMAVRNIDDVVNMFVQRRYEYYSDSVSWSHYGNGHWYIAKKDLAPLARFREQNGLT
nr:histone-lysine n-methyltransferase, h3 lysine-79 specific [Quercus suber]